MATDRQIVVATGNPGKVREIGAVLVGLPVEVLALSDLAPMPEPVEDGATFEANARTKARYYARATGLWCLADDSGLVVDPLDGRPGIHSARYAADECGPGADRGAIDAANNTKLLRELEGVGDERRTARFVCHLALADSHDVLLETSGVIEGHIAHAPAGENGFGYDPLFYVPELGCTTAQLPPERKNEVSHRGKAVRAFRRLLEQLLGTTP